MVFSVCNHKGGTGKTTTALNLGAALAKNGKRVLLVDLDPQGSLTYSLGLENEKTEGADNLISILLKESHASLPVVHSSNLFIVPGGLSYYDREIDLNSFSQQHRYKLLETELKKIEDNYDHIIIDCPPTLSTFTNLSLCASDKVIIPMQADVLSLKGLLQIMDHIEFIKREYNHDLEILGVLAVLVDERRQLTHEILEYIRDNYNVNIFNNYIHANVKAAEAPSFGKSVIDYAPESRSATDYLAFCKELLAIIEKNQKNVMA